MPTDTFIVLILVGCVFLLIAILGGGFKLYGVDIPGKVTNLWLRFLCFFLGVAFLIAAFPHFFATTLNSGLTSTSSSISSVPTTSAAVTVVPPPTSLPATPTYTPIPQSQTSLEQVTVAVGGIYPVPDGRDINTRVGSLSPGDRVVCFEAKENFDGQWVRVRVLEASSQQPSTVVGVEGWTRRKVVPPCYDTLINR